VAGASLRFVPSLLFQNSVQTQPVPAANYTVIRQKKVRGYWLSASLTSGTTKRGLNNQNPALALTGTTSLLIGSDSLAIAGRAVFSRETNPCGSCGTFHWEHPLREESPNKKRTLTKGSTTEAICLGKLVHYTSDCSEKNPPKGWIRS
jgi:hypothetical protein